MSYSESDTPPGADMADRTPSEARYLMGAALAACILAAAAAPTVLIIVFSVLVAATFIWRETVIVRRTVLTVLTLLILVLGLGRIAQPLHCDGCAGAAAWDGDPLRNDPAWVHYPSSSAGPWDYWQVARETCASQRVDDLARMFETKPTVEAVARAYSRWMPVVGYAGISDKAELRAVHAGCLQGFRDGRA